MQRKRQQAYLRALERVGLTPEDRARWVLRFAALDLGSLTEQARRALRWEPLAFLCRRSLPAPPFHHDPPLARLQARLREGLDHLKRKEKWPSRLSARAIAIATVEDDPRRWAHAMVWRAFEEIFHEEAYEVLMASRRPLRFCKECRRPFLRSKRQDYCALGCSQAMRTRTYRKTHREQLRALRRAAYAREMKKKLGLKVRVGRRGTREKATSS